MQYIIDIPPAFHAYADSTLARIQVAHPNFNIELNGKVFICQIDKSLNNEGWCKKIILHTLYKEKIYHETLPIRRIVIENLFK